jgi:hypothetical protein
MVFEKESHRQLFLAMFKQTNFPGPMVAVAAEVMAAVKAAKVLVNDRAKDQDGGDENPVLTS